MFFATLLQKNAVIEPQGSASYDLPTVTCATQSLHLVVSQCTNLLYS